MQTSGTLRLVMWGFGLTLSGLGLIFAQNALVWAVCALSLPLALEAASAGTDRAIVMANLSLFWAAIFNSVLGFELQPRGLEMPASESLAIYLSLLALLAIAFGYRIGFEYWRSKKSETVDVPLDRHKLLIAYWIAFFSKTLLFMLAEAFPLLVQPILAFQGVELLLLYFLAAQVLSDRAGYGGLVLAVLVEIVQGATGYIASYQLALLVVLAAALRSNTGAMRAGQWAAAGVIGALLVWMSLVWTAVKPEFRSWLATEDPAVTSSSMAKLGWITDYVSSGRVDYSVAFVRLSERIGYTRFYALAIPRMEVSTAPPTQFWLDAVTNILMPRVLFPDKPILNDTKITTDMTGVQFGAATSVSIGFVAQTHADFGFPLMLVPLFMIGATLGGVGGYFQSKNHSKIGRDGFVSAALVYKFGYEANIDKAMSTLALSSLALILVFRFAYPTFETWARKKQPMRPFARKPLSPKVRMRSGA